MARPAPVGTERQYHWVGDLRGPGQAPYNLFAACTPFLFRWTCAARGAERQKCPEGIIPPRLSMRTALCDRLPVEFRTQSPVRRLWVRVFLMRNSCLTPGEAKPLTQGPDVPRCAGPNLTGITSTCQLGETQAPGLHPSTRASETQGQQFTFSQALRWLRGTARLRAWLEAVLSSQHAGVPDAVS